MAQFDSSTTINPIVALEYVALSSDTTTDGETIDMQGYNSCTFVMHTAARTAGTLTPLIEESSTGAFSGEETAVADADLIGTEAGAALSVANKTSKIGYVGKERYVRFTVVSTASTDAFGVSAIAILGDSNTEPKSDQTP